GCGPRFTGLSHPDRPAAKETPMSAVCRSVSARPTLEGLEDRLAPALYSVSVNTLVAFDANSGAVLGTKTINQSPSPLGFQAVDFGAAPGNLCGVYRGVGGGAGTSVPATGLGPIALPPGPPVYFPPFTTTPAGTPAPGPFALDFDNAADQVRLT